MLVRMLKKENPYTVVGMKINAGIMENNMEVS
jgi:hypothetical protein